EGDAVGFGVAGGDAEGERVAVEGGVRVRLCPAGGRDRGGGSGGGGGEQDSARQAHMDLASGELRGFVTRTAQQASVDAPRLLEVAPVNRRRTLAAPTAGR
ncbi:hypothetical protein ADL26_05135, partial [Thermoactinomyces vulgaris]